VLQGANADDDTGLLLKLLAKTNPICAAIVFPDQL
jgi:hypothetical protein